MDKSSLGKQCICPICFAPYDEEDRLPLLFKECGHTFCRECILNFTKDKRLTSINCFACRRASSLAEGDLELSQFPVNYAILGILTESAIPLSDTPAEVVEVCPQHLLPANLVCFDSHTTSQKGFLCTRCVIQNHKGCNDALIFEEDRLKEKTFVVPLELNVAAAAAKAKENIECFYEKMKQRQLKLAETAFAFIQKEVEKVQRLSDISVLKKNLDALRRRVEPGRGQVILTHPQHKHLIRLFDDLQTHYSGTGLFRQLELCELDQSAYAMRAYLKANPKKQKGDIELLGRINHTDTFISKFFVMPGVRVEEVTSIDAFFTELKRVWNPETFATAKLTVLEGENHRSLSNMRTTIAEAFRSPEYHTNVGKLNHDLFKKFNFSLKNFFMKPIGFISVKMSSEFREGHKQMPHTVKLKINEVCLTIRT